MKSKIGLLMVLGKWFWDVGADKYYPGLKETIEKDSRKIVSVLEKEVEVIHNGINDTREKILNAIEKFKKEDIDLLVICPLMWSDDELLYTAIENISDVPILLWCYTPERKLPERVSMPELLRRSGPVAILQFSSPLARMNKKASVVIGTPDDKKIINEIKEYAEVSKLVKELKNTTIGVLPFRCEFMTGTFVDEFRLRVEIGPKLKYISVAEYKRIVDKVSEKEINEYLKNIKKKYKIKDVTEKTLYQASKVSIGLAKLVNDYNLDALAIDDLNMELHNEFGLRPCLSVDSLFDKAVVAMESDIGAVIGMLILKKLSCKQPMFTELFTYDLDDNAGLFGHAGIHDVRLAEGKVTITPDYEYAGAGKLEGAWMEFRAKHGKVTILSFVDRKDSFQMIATTGKGLSRPLKRGTPGTVPVLQGYPHMYIKLDIKLEEFLNNVFSAGIVQHFSIVQDDLQAKLEKLSKLLNLKK